MNNMGITFIDEEGTSVHTYDDYGFILKDAIPTFPKIKKKTIEIPGRDGVIDLTTALTGEPEYDNRSLNIVIVDLDDYHHFSALISQFAAFVNGKVLKIILDKDKSWYYRGYVEIDDYSELNKTDAAAFTLVCDLEPYKYAVDSTADRWRWDPFNFRTGKIENLNSIKISGSHLIEIDAGAKRVRPVITVTGSITLKIGETTYQLHPGDNTDVVLEAGMNELRFTGNGTITIDLIRRAF